MRSLQRTQERLRAERGATLPELMTGVFVSIIVILAVSQILDDGVRASGKVSPRVTAVQQGRLAMEEVTRQLRSQVCPGMSELGLSQPALIEAGDDSVTFYADFTAVGRVDKRSIVYEPAQRRLVEYVYTRQGAAPDWGVLPESPTRTRVLATDVVRAGETPVFRYYTFSTATPPAPDVLLGTPLSLEGRTQAVKLAISFASRPEGATEAGAAGEVVFQSEIFTRTADPANASGGTRCV